MNCEFIFAIAFPIIDMKKQHLIIPAIGLM